MGKVAGGMKGLTVADLKKYEAGGELTVAGYVMGPGDIKVVTEFKLPEGRKAEEVDAGGDGDVLVMLELEQDEELLEAGVAREVVNKFQRMRKTAGLTPGQTVEMYIGLTGDAEANAALTKMLSNQVRKVSTSESLKESFRVAPPAASLIVLCGRMA
eukprot:1258208-Pyramimonas_sp.AAC.1